MASSARFSSSSLTATVKTEGMFTRMRSSESADPSLTSSAIGSMMGAPRILQALGVEVAELRLELRLLEAAAGLGDLAQEQIGGAAGVAPGPVDAAQGGGGFGVGLVRVEGQLVALDGPVLVAGLLEELAGLDVVRGLLGGVALRGGELVDGLHGGRGVAELGYTLMDSDTPIQPILIGDDGAALALSRALAAHGVLVSAIRPPTVPEGQARLRVTLSAAHREADVDRLLGALEDHPCRV